MPLHYLQHPPITRETLDAVPVFPATSQPLGEHQSEPPSSQMPNWMFQDSSIDMFDISEQGFASIFDFNPSLSFDDWFNEEVMNGT